MSDSEEGGMSAFIKMQMRRAQMRGQVAKPADINPPEPKTVVDAASTDVSSAMNDGPPLSADPGNPRLDVPSSSSVPCDSPVFVIEASK